MKMAYIALAFTALISLAFAGSEGGGGDVIICGGKQRTLDSVVLEQDRFFNLLNYASTEEAMNQINTKLLQTLPQLGLSLTSFNNIYKSKGSNKEGVYWIRGVPKNVDDENLYVHIPESCQKDLYQAVVLVKEPFYRYYYNPEILANLEQENDELSWLLIHEWLRYEVDDADVIRIINGYLHSQDFIDSHEDEIKATLRKFGIESTGLSFSETEAANQHFIVFRVGYEKLLSDLEQALEQYPFVAKGKNKKLALERIKKLDHEVLALASTLLSAPPANDKNLESIYESLIERTNMAHKNTKTLFINTQGE